VLEEISKFDKESTVTLKEVKEQLEIGNRELI